MMQKKIQVVIRPFRKTSTDVNENFEANEKT